MLVVTVELRPGGPKAPASRRRILGVATIINDGEESRASGGARGTYAVALSKWEPKADQVWKQGRVEGFDRKKYGPWDLLFLAVLSALGVERSQQLLASTRGIEAKDL